MWKAYVACLNRSACVSGLLLASAYNPRSSAAALVLAHVQWQCVVLALGVGLGSGSIDNRPIVL